MSNHNAMFARYICVALRLGIVSIMYTITREIIESRIGNNVAINCNTSIYHVSTTTFGS